jgi:MFS family permease
MALLGDIVTPREMGKTMGWLTAATTGGITMGPLVAGYATTIDWRLAFVAIGLMTLVLAALIVATVRLPRIPVHDIAFGSLKTNMSLALRRRGVQMLALTGFLHVLVWIGTQAFTSNRLGEAPYLATAGQVGEVLAIAGLSSLIASRFGGSLADRIGRFHTVLLGNAIMVVSLLAMTSSLPSFESYIFFLAIFAVGSAISWTAQLTLAVEIVPSLRGTVSSIITSAGFTGGALSPVLLSPIQIAFGTDDVYLVGGTLCGIMCLTIYLVDMDLRRHQNVR